ncbi:MAG: RNA polymerase sigma factor [Candidatus Acidiferrales bacterium]
MTTDEQLIVAYLRGERDAFTELFERYRQPVYAFFRRRIANPARAEELAQECFIALIENAARYEPRASFRSYLYGIAIKMVWAERRKARSEVAENERLDLRVDATTGGSAGDTGIWVRDALGRLDDSEREILMLREYEQLSYEEIGILMRVPLNTVRSRLFRARAAMKEQLRSAEV